MGKITYFFKDNINKELDLIKYKICITKKLQEKEINLQPKAIVKYGKIKTKYIKTGKKLKIELDLEYIIKIRSTINILQDEVVKYPRHIKDCFNKRAKLQPKPYKKYFNMMVRGKYKVNNKEKIISRYVDTGSLLGFEGWDIDIENGKWIKNKRNVYISAVCSLKNFRGLGLMKILFQSMIDYYEKNISFNRLTLESESRVEKYYKKFNFDYILDEYNQKIQSHSEDISGCYMELEV